MELAIDSNMERYQDFEGNVSRPVASISLSLAPNGLYKDHYNLITELLKPARIIEDGYFLDCDDFIMDCNKLPGRFKKIKA
jgi:hypothetical protein